MDAKDLRTRLLAHTQVKANLFDSTRFLNMCRLGECPRKLAQEMLSGVEPNDDLKVRLWKTQQAEIDLHVRLEQILGKNYIGPRPIQGMDGSVFGYTDGECKGILLKFKSVPDDEALPNGRAPNNHYWMTQALMHFGRYKKCIIIYESRTSGRIRTYEHNYSPEMGKECEKKADLVLSAVKQGKLPRCACGKCHSR